MLLMHNVACLIILCLSIDVQEQLIPAMVGVLQRSLNVRKPVQGSLRLPHLCSSVFSQYPEYCLEVRS